jgi:hypothetical protein
MHSIISVRESGDRKIGLLKMVILGGGGNHKFYGCGSSGFCIKLWLTNDAVD